LIGTNGGIALEDQLGALEDLRQAGKLDLIGLFERRSAQVRLALEFVDVAGIQNGYSVIDRRDDEMSSSPASGGSRSFPFFPLARLSGAGRRDWLESPQSPGSRTSTGTPAQIALAWLLARYERMLLIPGTSSVAHLEENMAASEIELDAADLAASIASGAAERKSPASGEDSSPGRSDRPRHEACRERRGGRGRRRHAKTPLLGLRDVLALHARSSAAEGASAPRAPSSSTAETRSRARPRPTRRRARTFTTVEGASGPVVDAVRDGVAPRQRRAVRLLPARADPGRGLVTRVECRARRRRDRHVDERNLCRCGTYPRIRAAIHEAADTLAQPANPGPLSPLRRSPRCGG